MHVYFSNLRQPARVWLDYAMLYIPLGFIMNAFGQWAEIAMFAQWWQVLTCYWLYLIPASILWKHRSWFDQYLWGLLVLGGLEIAGYSLGTSIAFQNNIIDQIFTERNFALSMTIFFAAFIPFGNWSVSLLSKRRLNKAVGTREFKMQHVSAARR